MRGRKRKTEEQASSSSAREIRPESPLAVALLRMWCLGDLSAKIVQELSQAAVKSGCTQADLVGLASLGGHGVNPNHTHQQLVFRVFKNMAAPEPTVVETKAWGKNATGQKIQVDCKLPVLLPHSWMLSLDDMDEEILGIQDIARFWDSQTGANSRVSQSQDYFDQAFQDTQALVPFALHGDAAPHSKVDSLLVISMRAITSRRSIDAWLI